MSRRSASFTSHASHGASPQPEARLLLILSGAGCDDHTRTELVELMDLARTGQIDMSRAITRTVPLEAGAINGVLDDLEKGSGHLRTVIEVG